MLNSTHTKNRSKKKKKKMETKMEKDFVKIKEKCCIRHINGKI